MDRQDAGTTLESQMLCGPLQAPGDRAGSTNVTEKSTPWGGWAVSHALTLTLASGMPRRQLGSWSPPIRWGHLCKPPLQRAGLRVDVMGRNSAGALNTFQSPESFSQAPPARFRTNEVLTVSSWVVPRRSDRPARWGLTFSKPVWPGSHYHWLLKPLLADRPAPS